MFWYSNLLLCIDWISSWLQISAVSCWDDVAVRDESSPQARQAGACSCHGGEVDTHHHHRHGTEVLCAGWGVSHLMACSHNNVFQLAPSPTATHLSRWTSSRTRWSGPSQGWTISSTGAERWQFVMSRLVTTSFLPYRVPSGRSHSAWPAVPWRWCTSRPPDTTWTGTASCSEPPPGRRTSSSWRGPSPTRWLRPSEKCTTRCSQWTLNMFHF